MGSCLCKRKRVPASFDGRLPTTSFRIRSHQSGTIDIVRTSRGYHSTPNRKCKQISVRCLDVLYYIKVFISFIILPHLFWELLNSEVFFLWPFFLLFLTKFFIATCRFIDSVILYRFNKYSSGHSMSVKIF